ncbi:aldo/keto reductase [Chloroflexi bacterium TSY]|nr:aldo/keto reductase [Chloroflexi bacterium TSY]
MPLLKLAEHYFYILSRFFRVDSFFRPFRFALCHSSLYQKVKDKTLSELLNVSEELGKTPAQVATRWVLEQPTITSAIIGARTVDQAKDNMLAAGWRLEGDALERLNTISFLPHRYPRSMEENMHERRNSAIHMPSLTD